MVRFSFIVLVLFAVLQVIAPANATAEVVFSTFPGPDVENGGSCFGGGDSVAVGFVTPEDVSYRLHEVKVHLQINQDEFETPFSVDLYADESGFPGAKVANIGSSTGTWVSDPTYAFYNLQAAKPINLEKASAYWVVVSSSDPSFCAFGWHNDGTDPAGSTFTLLGEARSDAGEPWFAIQGFHQLEIRAKPKNGPPVGVGSAEIITGFDCGIPLVITQPGDYFPTFTNGNGLLVAPIADDTKAVITHSKNGNISLKCKGNVDFGEPVEGIQPALNQPANGVIVSFEEMCDTWKIVAPDACKGRGVIKLNSRTLGVPCEGFGMETDVWQQVIRRNGKVSLICNFRE